MLNDNLRIGCIIDQNPIPLWKYYIIEKISQLDFCELCYINEIDKNSSEKNIKKSKLQSLLFNYEQRKTIKNPSSFKKQKLTSFSKIIYSSKNHISNNELIITEDKIIDKNLDVLINLSSVKIKSESADLIKFGIWYFDTTKTYEDLEGFSEILNNIPIITSNLQCIKNIQEDEKNITKCYSPTNFLSIKRSTNDLNWNKSKNILLSLEKLHRLKKLETDSKSEIIFKNNLILNNRQYIELLLKMMYNSIKLKIQNRFYFDQWVLMFNFNSQLSTSFSKFQILKPSKDRFWADPHIIYEYGIYHIFLEEFLYAQNKGHITLFQMDKNGNILNKKKILEKSYHMSYPFVFKYENTYYMIPETHSNHTIELYESTEFPFTWKFCKNLMNDVDAVDTTIFHHNDKWWLFTNISKYDQIKNWDDLFLFSSDNLIDGIWKPHPCNPIVSDIRKSRSAGKIFLDNGNIIRPSQDGSTGYGSSIVLNKIHLNEEKYTETVLKTLKPNWDSTIIGLHTIQHTSGLTMIDAKMKRKR